MITKHIQFNPYFIFPSRKVGVSIATCSSCHRKFASTADNQPPVCRSCRGGTLTPPKSKPGFQLGPNIQFISSPKISRPSKQSHTPTTVAGSNRRTKLSPLSCKICNASFLYRRCLFRHLRENHSGIDMNNLTQYIEVGSIELEEEMTEANGERMDCRVDSMLATLLCK